tara:strand:+ start:184 stop:669 length:486 start_codon:yes stop_codon:yes gene_type:complete
MMDNIQPLITAKPIQADAVKVPAKLVQGDAVKVPAKPVQGDAVKIKNSQKASVAQLELNQLAPFKEAAELRAETHAAREEASKNQDTIRDRLKEISISLNEDINIRSKNLKFSVGDTPYRSVVEVVDAESGEVIRQIPSEAILKVAHNLEALKGIIFDDSY